MQLNRSIEDISTNKETAISAIAQDLDIYTPQGVAVNRDEFVVPTLDGKLLQVDREGKVSLLTDLAKADLGIPFGIAQDNDDLIVTTSGFVPVHYLVRVKRNGTVSTIADLSDLSGDYGAPFGVAVNNGSYIVTLSTDVVESMGVLLKVEASGTVSKIADLAGFGNPFGVSVSKDEFVVAQSKGQLLRVTRTSKVSVIVDLQKAGFGIPFGVAERQSDWVVTTNLGWVAKIDRAGKVEPIVNLLQARFGVPSGIVASRDELIVTTNSGYLLRIR